MGLRINLPTVGIAPEISAVRDFEKLASLSTARRHELVEDPESADVLLFTECHQLGDPITLRRIRNSKPFRAFPEKSFVFDQRPRAYCSAPGLFTSVPWRQLRTAYQVPWSYHSIEGVPSPADEPPDLLFSFVGTAYSHPCRAALLRLEHPRAIVKQIDGHVNWQVDDPGFAQRKNFFSETVRRSAFVLCPRGRATSSFRFYETMAAGRVPVILADDWVPPWGINISEFAIRWPEANVDGLIHYLEENQHRAEAMGRRARHIFEERFAPDVMFDNIGDALEMLSATQPWKTFPRLGFPPDRRVVRHAAGLAKRRLSRLHS